MGAKLCGGGGRKNPVNGNRIVISRGCEECRPGLRGRNLTVNPHAGPNRNTTYRRTSWTKTPVAIPCSRRISMETCLCTRSSSSTSCRVCREWIRDTPTVARRTGWSSGPRNTFARTPLDGTCVHAPCFIINNIIGNIPITNYGGVFFFFKFVFFPQIINSQIYDRFRVPCCRRAVARTNGKGAKHSVSQYCNPPV